MQERVSDYFAFGVPYVWIVDPRTRKCYNCTLEGVAETGVFRTDSRELLERLPSQCCLTEQLQSLKIVLRPNEPLYRDHAFRGFGCEGIVNERNRMVTAGCGA